MDHLAVLLLELGVLLAGLAVLAVLARRLSLSAIPFFLLAGLAFGEDGLVPLDAADDFVGVAAEIGVILLLLTLGLEFTATDLVASLNRHRSSGVVDFLLNATPGFAAGWLLGLSPGGIMALGGITWISSSGIIARLLGELGRLANRETPAVLSVLVLEDLLMAVYLPVLVVLLAGGGPMAAVAGVVAAVVAVTGVLLMAHRGGDRLHRILHHEDDEQVLLRVLGLTLLVAGLTQAMGASAAVGAFLVGIAIPHQLAERARDLLSPLRDLFAAIFFGPSACRSTPPPPGRCCPRPWPWLPSGC